MLYELILVFSTFRRMLNSLSNLLPAKMALLNFWRSMRRSARRITRYFLDRLNGLKKPHSSNLRIALLVKAIEIRAFLALYDLLGTMLRTVHFLLISHC